MFKVNEDYLKLPGSYLCSTNGKKVSGQQQANPYGRFSSAAT